MAALPFFDEIDPSTIDLCLVTHFHLDHCAALPFLVEKTNFRGRVFMTHPTKAIYKILLTDYVKVSHGHEDEMLFSEQDLTKSMDKVELIDYHQELEFNGIKFTCYNAGHVLGASMFMVEIAGVRVLYTGDFSRQEDRHLLGAEIPDVHVDVLIVEATYGTQIHEPREERENFFTTCVDNIVTRGGRCLIPVFALGRAQELLLILDEYWEAHPELQHIPIYYASSLAKRCMSVYQTYINMMNDNIRSQLAIGNPWIFKHISNLKSMDHFDDLGPCVVMASPGMLQSGLSRQLFEMWCPDKRNGVVIPGYCVEGTLAKVILTEPTEIISMQGVSLPMRCSVHYVSFSAHSDFMQTSEFIRGVKPPHIVLVHGDHVEMSRLKKALEEKFVRDGKEIKEASGKTDKAERIDVRTPANCETVRFEFRGDKVANMVGKLAATTPVHGQFVKGIIVRKDFGHQLVAPQDLPEFTHLSTTTIKQRQIVPFRQPLAILEKKLHEMYENVARDITRDRKARITVANKVCVVADSIASIVIEYDSGAADQAIADSVLTVAIQLEAQAQDKLLGFDLEDVDVDLCARVEEKLRVQDAKHKDQQRRDQIIRLFKAYFGECEFKQLEQPKSSSDGETPAADGQPSATTNSDDKALIPGTEAPESSTALVTKPSNSDPTQGVFQLDLDDEVAIISAEAFSRKAQMFASQRKWRSRWSSLPASQDTPGEKEKEKEQEDGSDSISIRNQIRDMIVKQAFTFPVNEVVLCANSKLKNRIEVVIQRIRSSLFPIPDFWCGCCG
eukprot:TRINITY_DN899_c0_g1::TRINITY_DN899_c0_g1_i1::g.25416::m.25416 TRINITY_DN899_c0_g1::TRINITY_DN899_c0_g1_i1::g.25416  ORF type:complete len:855 (+),score=243.34,sp/P79101/CPSF3_BOVIN/56.77/0.0,Beta-Casp/PF10996.3/4e-32,CPSF73-100_C/PF11718.3/8.2e+02,CPSF73-100_C/PF11718.3/1.1e-27,CPSF73-100_C/PF11718.3/1.3e+02,Lactamase_B/PF00753.22/2.5e-15,Lactamase_B_2/PF12706.2/3e-12,Lactamase_B_2/PF12706.2/2e+03,RMMBL/PF07521.7/3.1e-11,Lactamase_B_3/PF13483.1/3.2e-05,Lactamase_B_3/PF13483.1/4.6e+03 TRINITY_DN8